MDVLIPAAFEHRLRDIFLAELAEGSPLHKSAIYAEQLQMGNLRGRMAEAEVVVDGVPLVLTATVSSGRDSVLNVIQGVLDLSLYCPELDVSMADHAQSFQHESEDGETAAPDLRTWFEEAFAGARAELEECPEFLALREAAQLRLSVKPARGGIRPAARL